MRALIPLMLLAALGSAAAQPLRFSAVSTEQYTVGDEQVDALVARPAVDVPRPVVIVLADRFGLGLNIRSILQVFAGQGFRTYALSLRSTPVRPAVGCPPETLDTTDIPRIASIVADVLAEKGSSGTAVLFAMDAGANIGLITASRLPIFKAAAFIAPIPDSTFLEMLKKSDIPVFIASGADDSEGTATVIQQHRAELIEAGRRIDAVVYKGAKRFFFNSLHADYNKSAMNLAWNEALRLFRSVLVP